MNFFELLSVSEVFAPANSYSLADFPLVAAPFFLEGVDPNCRVEVNVRGCRF